MRGADPERTPCRSPPVRGKRRCRIQGGAPGSGAATGYRNALNHGQYTAKATPVRWRSEPSCARPVNLFRRSDADGSPLAGMNVVEYPDRVVDIIHKS